MITLRFINPIEWQANAVACAKRFTKSGSIIYVTVLRSHHDLLHPFQEAGIDADRVHYIDLARHPSTHKHKETTHHCTTLNSMENLNEVEIAITTTLSKVPDAALVIDAVSGLFLYHDPDTIGQFLLHITAFARSLGRDCVIVASPPENPEERSLIGMVATLADEVEGKKDLL
ncbi:hypothetical protein HY493_00745 [Candidatus Woesearchaeota archaeon]|nr:hypothetical protein [Candidatus Woesearchaeota archaeon]